MINIEREYIVAIEKIGYKHDENICEFWFNNVKKCRTAVNAIRPFIDQSLELKIRWYSYIGVKCREAVVSYIKAMQDASHEASNRALKHAKGDLFNVPVILANINFNLFKFTISGTEYDLVKFAAMFPTSQIRGQHDLRGICLDNIIIGSSKIINANFGNSSFRKSKFQQVFIYHSNFGNVDFSESTFHMVRLLNGTNIGSANFINSSVNAIDLNDRNTGNPIKYSEISYWILLKHLFIALKNGKSEFNEKDSTRFLCVDADDLTKQINSELKHYVKWYQHIQGVLINFSNLSISEKILFSISLISTKYWMSYICLSGLIAVLNILFTVCYYMFDNQFYGINGSFLSALYFSIVTFTTLGYGDIRPVAPFGQLLVIIEVLIGYIC